MTRDEIEADRLERLLALDKDYAHDDPEWRDRFKPGSFDGHEALHTVSILQAVVEEHLVDHPAVLLNSECFALGGYGDTIRNSRIRVVSP